MDIKQEFREEKNIDVYAMNVNDGSFSNVYVKWLEAKINYTHCCTELKTVNEPLPYAEWKANLKMQKIEETIFKIGNDYKTMNDLLDMYGSYCNSF
jgi:hypothetical protein